MFGKIIRRAFWLTYDRLGRAVLLNLIWFLLVFTPLLVLQKSLRLLALPWLLASLVGWVAWAGLVSGALFHAVMFMQEERELGFLRLFWRGLRRGLLSAPLLSVLSLVVLWLAYFNVRFYLTNLPGPAGMVLAGLVFWLAVFWLCAQQYFLPLACMVGRDSWRSFKGAFALALDNFLLSFSLLLIALVFVVLCALPYGVGLMLFVACGLAAFYRAAGEVMMLKYDQPFHPDQDVAETRRQLDRERGLREFFYPWKR